MADFIARALIAGLLIAIIAGPLGCFVVWRRMAYFGDTLAHAALLGIAFGLLLDIDFQLAVVAVCLAVALLLVWMESRYRLTADTLLGILAHGTLAFGLVVLSFTETQINLMAYLFGDLLTVGTRDLWWIAVGAALTGVFLFRFWGRLLTITLHQELAQVEGLDVKRVRLVLMLLIAAVIALSMKIVGVLLITSLLIIPPATARGFASSPGTMAALASLIGCTAVCGGLLASWFWDTPTGPSIVVTAALLFLFASSLRK